jgi:hypothetical protein
MESEKIIAKTIRVKDSRNLEDVKRQVQDELEISDAEIRYLKEPWMVEVKGVYQGASEVFHIKLIDRSYVDFLLYTLPESINKILGVSDAKIESRSASMACNPKKRISKRYDNYTVTWSSGGRQRRGRFSIDPTSLYSSQSPEEDLYKTIAAQLNR